MPFYKVITPYYDHIFPMNDKTKQFLAANLKKGGKVLDVGAGTGNMALSLANDGFAVTATEPEEMMAGQILVKAEEGKTQINVTTKSMQQLEDFPEGFDGIYCIGNTLAHLNTLEEFSQFFQQSYKKLNENGTLIFQIVNFEKVLANQDFHFPVIKKDEFEFQRSYDLQNGKILFTTTLLVDGKSQSNTIPLYPATAAELLPLLERAGFEQINTFGNFNEAPYSIQSPALIVTAAK
ncbi:class I SAM-dependent methyltransferase [Cytobacillus sp. FJAT-53684]|uniref:Class I SAM-dependent methyltransferase n=1 Tax=Cytobacillus mangrovibacter TaxID=3299024 RepID=A0ABW6K143_9BACI